MNPQNLEALIKAGSSQLNKPYQFGYKPENSDPNPKAFDCSGLVRWVWAQAGVAVPDGSQQQFDASFPVEKPQIGDVGFFRLPGAPTHHVGLFWTDGKVLEARGFEPILEAQGIKSNCVLLRPQSKWEAFSEFTGWRRFKQT